MMTAFRRQLLWLLVAGCFVGAVPAEDSTDALDRSQDLQRKLRCLVCQNQSIAESNAELASDLRRQIDDLIAAGRTDEEIVSFMTERYGDFVLYQPPLKPTTYLLWTGPILMLLIAGIAFWRLSGRKSSASDAAKLTSEECERARRLLDDDHGGSPT